MRVAILQSNYIPWKGYFDIIDKVDLFVFHDDLQYTKNDWRNRNRIKTDHGLQWLTIPCGTNENRLICDVAINDHSWQMKHWRLLENYYRDAEYFNDYKNYFREIYLCQKFDNLSKLNQFLIKKISREFVGSKTEFSDSRLYNLKNKKGDRVLELLEKVGATTYLSGPAAKNYLTHESFESKDIELEWMDYSNYPVYPQLYPPFLHDVTILDMIFNLGPDVKRYMDRSI